MTSVASLFSDPTPVPVLPRAPSVPTLGGSNMSGIFSQSPFIASASHNNDESLTFRKGHIVPSAKRFASSFVFGDENAAPVASNVARGAKTFLTSNVCIAHTGQPDVIKSAKGRSVVSKNDSNFVLSEGSYQLRPLEKAKISIETAAKNASHLVPSSGGVSSLSLPGDDEPKTQRGSVRGNKNTSRVFLDAKSPNAKTVRKGFIANPQEGKKVVESTEVVATACTARKNSSILTSSATGFAASGDVTQSYPFSKDVMVHKNVRNNSSLWAGSKDPESRETKKVRGMVRNKNEGNGNIVNWK